MNLHPIPLQTKTFLVGSLTVPGTRAHVGAPTRESPMLRRSICCPLLLCYLAACTSWHVEEGVSPLQFITAEHPRVVRLTRTNGSYVDIDNPQVAAGDTVTGIHNTALSRIAVSDVTQVATPRVSAGKTIGLFLGLSVVAVGIAVVACVSSDCVDN